MKIVGIEEHFLTNSVKNAWSALEQDGSEVLKMGEAEKRLDDLSDGRIRLMDESGVDVQVLSLTSPGLHNLDSVKSVDLARQTNDLVSGAVALRPDHFEEFATLPTAAPREAARELERSIFHLGLKGAMLCGRTREKTLIIVIFYQFLRQQKVCTSHCSSILKFRNVLYKMPTILVSAVKWTLLSPPLVSDGTTRAGFNFYGWFWLAYLTDFRTYRSFSATGVKSFYSTQNV